MIRYALACNAGHTFESWFRDSDAFDRQAATGSLTCPACASAEVRKAVMAPAVVGGRSPAIVEPATTEPARPSSPEENGSPNVALLDESSRELRTLLRQVKQKLVAEGHDVGRGFAEEARRIHEGEAPLRQIYGQASLAEARDLLEDGIAVLPMPIVPDDFN